MQSSMTSVCYSIIKVQKYNRMELAQTVILYITAVELQG
ncbi:hypothetical protein PVAP13_3NG140842 [Panicum virgatum]|uniref:Uncharacterized protein n=1 Tax=Panicum virgatum TaxID=38727 RepID=A0A8T0UDQ0_PANVG|nr:hypothetical protein PVAP13_3NG140842 [Panicum virgatum]